MTLRWYYSVDATTVLEITDRVRLPVDPEGVAIAVGAKADAGAGWEGELLVDDQAGTFIPLMDRRIYCVQDAAPAGTQVVGNWFISNIRVRRMDPWNSVSRSYAITMADENSLLNRRKFVGSDANRPSETDIVRLRWALTTTELNVLSPDETYIDTTGPVTLDAADLRTQGPEELFMSLMQASGKHYWIKYEEAAAVGGAIVSSSVASPTVITTTSAHGLTTGQTIVIAGHTGSTPAVDGTYVVTVTGATTYTIPLNVTVGGTGGTSTTVGRYVVWYANMNISNLYASTVSLSNLATEIGEPASTLVWPMSEDAELDRAGGRMASGLVAPYKTGWVYVQDTAVGDTYAYIDRVAPAPNVATSAKATAQVTRQLAELDLPDDEITTTWTVEAADLNLIKHGMRLPVHVTHFPNYTDDTDSTLPGYQRPGYANGFVWCRVMERTVRQIGPTTFEVPLRLSPQETPVPLNAYMCGPYNQNELFTPQQVFWQNAGGECDKPPITGVTMLGTVPAFEGWGFSLTGTISFHTMGRVVPASAGAKMQALLNGVMFEEVTWPGGTDVVTMDPTVNVVPGDQITFLFIPPAGLARGMTNISTTDPTYITGGTLT